LTILLFDLNIRAIAERALPHDPTRMCGPHLR